MHSNALVIPSNVEEFHQTPLAASTGSGILLGREEMAARNNSGKAPVTGASARRRPTSYDVARLASVSQSAVSRCFAPGGSIAPETRDRIIKVAAELGYRPNALAQGLISGRTNLVGVLIPSLTSLYYPDVLAEISQQLTERDIRVLLFSLRSESEVDGVLDEVWRHSVDGVP